MDLNIVKQEPVDLDDEISGEISVKVEPADTDNENDINEEPEIPIDIKENILPPLPEEPIAEEPIREEPIPEEPIPEPPAVVQVKTECNTDSDTTAEEQDVPENFFDDFTNQEFMAGLDIVDDAEWDENKKTKRKPTKKRRKKRDSKKAAEEPKKKLEEPKKKPEEPKKKPESPKKKPESPKKKPEQSKKIPQPPTLQKDKSPQDDSTGRRDPEKTKRDIQKDKVKCAKDKEKKLITERLNVVETGLVPPGMEMEVDLPLLNPQPKSRSGRDIKRKAKSRSRSRSRRSPRKRRSPSPLYRGSRSRRRSRSRDRSYSPRRSSRRRTRSHSRSPRRRPEKKSFLEEITEKLNYVPPQPVPPPPTASTSYFNPTSGGLMPMYDPYDQQYFIGTPTGNLPSVPGPPISTPAYVGAPVQMVAPLQSMEMPLILGNQNVGINPVAMQAQSSNNFVYPLTKPIKVEKNVASLPVASSFNRSPEELEKMLEEKRISLTDFLSITAKPEVRSSHQNSAEEKLKIITRCQDAIRFLSNKILTGRLIVRFKHTLPEPDKSSPLSIMNLMKLPYTTPSEHTDEQNYTATLIKLLRYIGVDTSQVKSLVPKPARGYKQETLDAPVAPPAPKISNDVPRPKLFTKMVQTEPMRCERCAKRDKIKYVDNGVQCGDTMSYSVATQVNEEDLLPKHKSLATLTPAQLLGRPQTQTMVASTAAQYRRDDDFDALRFGRYDRPNYPPVFQGQVGGRGMYAEVGQDPRRIMYSAEEQNMRRAMYPPEQDVRRSMYPAQGLLQPVQYPATQPQPGGSSLKPRDYPAYGGSDGFGSRY